MYAMFFFVTVCILVFHNENKQYNKLGSDSKTGLLNYGIITLKMGQEFHFLLKLSI